jgi:hypothetical protein
MWKSGALAPRKGVIINAGFSPGVVFCDTVEFSRSVEPSVPLKTG